MVIGRKIIKRGKGIGGYRNNVKEVGTEIEC